MLKCSIFGCVDPPIKQCINAPGYYFVKIALLFMLISVLKKKLCVVLMKSRLSYQKAIS